MTLLNIKSLTCKRKQHRRRTQ